MNRKIGFIGFILFTMVTLTSCHFDIFHLSERKIAGKYYLERWEDGVTFYLDDGEEHQGGGVIDGTVLQIGWNSRYIVVERLPNFGGDKRGWMVVNVDKETITGPYSDEIINTMPEAKGMRFMEPKLAWKELSGSWSWL